MMRAAEGAIDEVENRLRSAAAAILEGRAYEADAVANACIEAADLIARSPDLPLPVAYVQVKNQLRYAESVLEEIRDRPYHLFANWMSAARWARELASTALERLAS